MMRKLTSAALLLMALVLSRPALSLIALAQGSDTPTAASPAVLTENESQSPLGLLLEILEDPVSD